MSQLIQEPINPMRAFDKHFLEATKLVIESGSKEDLTNYREFLLDPKKWRLPLVSFDTFLDSPHYLGVGNFVYPEIRRISKEILAGKYPEAIIVAGIGSGKTTAAELLACYMTHKLLCLRDPYDHFQLAKDKPIALINMGTTATQALKVAFEGIKNFMKNSPWFMNFNPKILTGEIVYPHSNILLISGNSKSTMPLGYNVFFGALDEAAFYLDNDNRQVAGDIYESLQRRIVSRFGYDGLMMAISSPLYESDFIMTKLEEAKQSFSKEVYACQLPTWRGKPIEKADMVNKFYFNSRTGIILDNPPEPGEPFSAVEKPFEAEQTIWEIPGEYRKSFVQDPDRAKRDLAGVPSGAIEGFMAQKPLIDEMFTEAESPVQEDGSYKFAARPLRTDYFVHLDLALNKNGGDHAGLAMAHLAGWEYNDLTQEEQKVVVVDLAEQISAGPTGEIRFEDVRNKIYALQAMGFNIRMVTMDQFQSADTKQILRAKSIRSEILSVDRTVDPYNTLKELIYSKRIKCHQMPVLSRELKQLEITKSMKIDHPPKGSKDVADAVCGAVFNVMEQTGSGGIGIMTGDLNHIEQGKPSKLPPLKKGQVESEMREKTEEYALLDEMARDGLL